MLLYAGPQNQQGLQLRSFRIDGGLEGRVQLPKAYQAFPGIVNGGAVGGLFDCHGNWTAAIALMDHSSLPKPPLTLTAEVLVSLFCLFLESNSYYLCTGDPVGVVKETRSAIFSLPEGEQPAQITPHTHT